MGPQARGRHVKVFRGFGPSRGSDRPAGPGLPWLVGNGTVPPTRLYMQQQGLLYQSTVRHSHVRSTFTPRLFPPVTLLVS
jgi:hypothetical protein